MSPAIPPQRPRTSELLQFLLIVSLGCLALVAPLVGPGQVFCPPGDATVRHLPWMQFLRDSIRGGVFPLWNPHNGLGEPFLANPQTAVMFPLSWLYVVLPMTVASFLELYLKILVAALGMYLFARRLGMGHSTAVVGGVAFGFLPHFILQAGHVASNSEMCIPWALAATLMYIETGRYRWAAALAGVLTLSLVGGALQVWGGTLLLVMAFFLWFGRWDGSWRARVRYLAGFLTFIPWMLASSAGVWLQYLEYFRRSESAALGQRINLFLSPPAHLLHLLLPSFFGDLQSGNVWAWAEPREVVLYAGVAVLLLALTHLFSRGGWHEKSFYFAAMTLFWMLCLRQPAAAANAVLRTDLFSGLDFPQLFGIFNLCLLVPALRALDGWRWRDKRWPLITAAAIMASGAVLGAAVFYEYFRALGLRSFELRNYAVFFFFLMAAAGALRYWESRRQLTFCALLGLVFADLYLADRAMVGAEPLQRLKAGREDLAKLVQSLPDANGARFYTPDFPPESNLFYGISSIGIGPSRALSGFERIASLLDRDGRRGSDLEEPGDGSVDRIDSGTLKRRRLKRLSGIYGAEQIREALSRPAGSLVAKVDDFRLAARLGVRYILARRIPESVNGKMVRQEAGWSVCELPGASNRLTFHERVGWTGTTDQAISRLLEDPTGCWQQPTLVGPHLPETQAGISGETGENPGSSITLERLDALTVEANVQVATGGWLLLMDLYDPGWQASVDGARIQVLPANGICRAVAVPSGKHRILFTYQPWTFRAGFLTGVITLLALCGWGVIGWYRWSTRAR